MQFVKDKLIYLVVVRLISTHSLPFNAAS